MLIILEGPDGAGKTMLAREIQRQLYGTDSVTVVLHKGPPKSDGFTEYLVPLDTYTPGRGLNVICDRWHLGELVYPEIFNREPVLDRLQFGYLDLFLRSRGALLVHVTASYGTLIKRVRERESGESYLEVIQGCDGFGRSRSISTLPWYPVDTTVHQHEDLVETAKRIIARAQATENGVKELAEFPNYAGPPRPDLLLLGDVRGKKRLDIPTAFAPLSSSSGQYLHRAIDGEALAGGRVGFANVHECQFDDLWETLGRPATVVLGNEAHDTVVSDARPMLQYEFGYVPHPQFVRRFHHHHAAGYGRLIRDAAIYRKDLRSWRP